MSIPSIFNEQTFSTTLVESFVAPSSVVRSFSEFLSCREDDDVFIVRTVKVPFLECSVKVGEKMAVAAYECLNYHDMPLNTHSICRDIIQNAENFAWKEDSNYKQFAKWYKTRFALSRESGS